MIGNESEEGQQPFKVDRMYGSIIDMTFEGLRLDFPSGLDGSFPTEDRLVNEIVGRENRGVRYH